MDNLLTTDDVAEILKTTHQRVQTMCRQGQIGYVKIAGLRGYLFTREHVEECIKAHETKPLDQTKQEGDEANEQQSERIFRKGPAHSVGLRC